MKISNTYEFDQYGLCAETEEAVDLFVSIDPQSKKDIIPIQRQTVFTTVKDDQVFDSIMDQCKSIAENLDVHELVAFMILETQNWNVHRVYENWTQFKDTIFATIGINPEWAHNDPSLRNPDEPDDAIMDCMICCDQCPPKQMWQLQCGHTFCTGCWKEHVKSYVLLGRHQINCQMEGCRCKLPPNSVEMICGKDVYNNLLRFMMDQQVNLADTLTNCPNPSCGKPINVLTTGICGTLKCSCHHEFCSECHETSHAPTTCAEKQQWDIVTGDDVMQKRLFGENVKKCPKCNTIIEKNGGCNHMICFKCHHEFCWMCMHDWVTHPKDFYKCEIYRKEDDPFLKKPDNINKEFLAQFHDQFMKFEVSNKARKEKINELAQVLARKVQTEQGVSCEEINEATLNLLYLIYWTNENFKWAYPHLFSMRYRDVKDLPVENQCVKGNEKPEYKIFKFVLENTIKAVSEIESKVTSSVHSGNARLTYINIIKYTRKITLLRESFLKQCDPHY